jgi:hypothetical protein
MNTRGLEFESTSFAVDHQYFFMIFKANTTPIPNLRSSKSKRHLLFLIGLHAREEELVSRELLYIGFF